MSKSRVLILGLDGLPFSLLQEFIAGGVMPNLGRLCQDRPLIQMDSVLPTVSSVAWSSFATARNPGKFGVFGFAELDQDRNIQIPDSRSLRCETIWETLANAGRRVQALSVPLTHPPRSVPGGMLVSCFLADSLGLGEVTPPTALRMLREQGYEIDVDPTVAWVDRDQFVMDLHRVLRGRQRTLRELLRRDEWDLLLLHVMETDRISHFLLKDYRQQPDSAMGRKYTDLFRAADELVGEAANSLPADAALIILSDHGFCPVESEVQLNRWLLQEGYLSVSGDVEEIGFAAMDAGSRAFAMVPGRIYLARKSRWKWGTLEESAAQRLRDELRERLLALRHPASGRPIAKSIEKAEDVFSGPYVGQAPDLLIDPEDGFDFKAQLTPGDLFTHSPVTGMHTFYDAHLWCSEALAVTGKPRVLDVPAIIFDLLRVDLPSDCDASRLGLVNGAVCGE